jgi:hypothetical protein
MLVRYCPESGKFNRLVKLSNNCKMNDIAITKKNGYQYVNTGGKTYLAHRLAFMCQGVEIPEGFEVDHKNGIRNDNRWDNLRLVSRSQNLLNKESKNIYHDKRRDNYYVQIRVSGKLYTVSGLTYQDALIEREKLIESLGVKELRSERY